MKTSRNDWKFRGQSWSQLCNLLMTASQGISPASPAPPPQPLCQLPPVPIRLLECHRTHSGHLCSSASPLINSPAPGRQIPSVDTDDSKSEFPAQTSALSHRFPNPSALLTFYILSVNGQDELSKHKSGHATLLLQTLQCGWAVLLSIMARAVGPSSPACSTLRHASLAPVDTPNSSCLRVLALPSPSGILFLQFCTQLVSPIL